MEASSEGLPSKAGKFDCQTSYLTERSGPRRFLWKQEHCSTQNISQSLQKICWKRESKSRFFQHRL